MSAIVMSSILRVCTLNVRQRNSCNQKSTAVLFSYCPFLYFFLVRFGHFRHDPCSWPLLFVLWVCGDTNSNTARLKSFQRLHYIHSYITHIQSITQRLSWILQAKLHKAGLQYFIPVKLLKPFVLCSLHDILLLLEDRPSNLLMHL